MMRVQLRSNLTRDARRQIPELLRVIGEERRVTLKGGRGPI
jgi:hypothetical protein